MNEWLDKTEINLELLTTDPPNPEEKLTLEEQMVLIKVTNIVLFEIHLKIIRTVIASIGGYKEVLFNCDFIFCVSFCNVRTRRVM